MTLHSVNKSPFERNSLATCIRLSKAGSAVILIEDGVYGALKGTGIEQDVKTCLQDRKVFALQPDLSARGLDESKLIEGITPVDYGEFVELAATHDKVQSWL